MIISGNNNFLGSQTYNNFNFNDNFVQPPLTAAATSSIKTFDGLAYASTKTVYGLALASVKTYEGLT